MMAKTKKKKPTTIYSVGFMILLAAIFSGILAALYIITNDKIVENGMLDKQKAILKAASIDASDDEVSKIFEEDFKLITDSPREVYLYQKDDKDGYVFSYEGGGLWGQITGFAGIDKDLEKLYGISVYTNNETPGLGGRITEDWYQDQYRDLEVKEGDFIVYRPAPGGNIDAISGATLTSNSMKDMLNSEIGAFEKEAKEGNYEK